MDITESGGNEDLAIVSSVTSSVRVQRLEAHQTHMRNSWMQRECVQLKKTAKSTLKKRAKLFVKKRKLVKAVSASERDFHRYLTIPVKLSYATSAAKAQIISLKAAIDKKQTNFANFSLEHGRNITELQKQWKTLPRMQHLDKSKSERDALILERDLMVAAKKAAARAVHDRLNNAVLMLVNMYYTQQKIEKLCDARLLMKNRAMAVKARIDELKEIKAARCAEGQARDSSEARSRLGQKEAAGVSPLVEETPPPSKLSIYDFHEFDDESFNLAESSLQESDYVEDCQDMDCTVLSLDLSLDGNTICTFTPSGPTYTSTPLSADTHHRVGEECARRERMLEHPPQQVRETSEGNQEVREKPVDHNSATFSVAQCPSGYQVRSSYPEMASKSLNQQWPQKQATLSHDQGAKQMAGTSHQQWTQQQTTLSHDQKAEQTAEPSRQQWTQQQTTLSHGQGAKQTAGPSHQQWTPQQATLSHGQRAGQMAGALLQLGPQKEATRPLGQGVEQTAEPSRQQWTQQPGNHSQRAEQSAGALFQLGPQKEAPRPLGQGAEPTAERLGQQAPQLRASDQQQNKGGQNIVFNTWEQNNHIVGSLPSAHLNYHQLNAPNALAAQIDPLIYGQSTSLSLEPSSGQRVTHPAPQEARVIQEESYSLGSQRSQYISQDDQSVGAANSSYSPHFSHAHGQNRHFTPVGLNPNNQATANLGFKNDLDATNAQKVGKEGPEYPPAQTGQPLLKQGRNDQNVAAFEKAGPSSTVIKIHQEGQFSAGNIASRPESTKIAAAGGQETRDKDSNVIPADDRLARYVNSPEPDYSADLGSSPPPPPRPTAGNWGANNNSAQQPPEGLFDFGSSQNQPSTFTSFFKLF